MNTHDKRLLRRCYVPPRLTKGPVLAAIAATEAAAYSVHTDEG